MIRQKKNMHDNKHNLRFLSIIIILAISITFLAFLGIKNETLVGKAFTQSSGLFILSPNGGEQWPVGSIQSIKWRGGNPNDKVRISLIKQDANGKKNIAIIKDNLANSGSYEWKVPQVNLSNDYFIRICRIARFNCKGGDDSDAAFRIVAMTPIIIQNIKSIEYPGPNYSQPHRTWTNFNPSVFRNDVQQIKKSGFNTLWLITFWSDFQDSNFQLKDDVFGKLNQALQILEENQMYTILSPQYGIGGLTPLGVHENILLFDDQYWQTFENYVESFSKRLANHKNVIFLFYTEGTEPNRGFMETFPDDPDTLLMIKNFRDWAASINSDVSYWNARWGTSFTSMDVILPNPSTNNGANDRFFDYQRWTSSLIRKRFLSLPGLIKKNNPSAPVGYHDYSLINLDWAKGDLPIPPSANPFDFFSFVFYPWTSSDITNASKIFEQRYDNFVRYYSQGPSILGETGLCNANFQESQRVDFFNKTLPKVSEKKIGINIWNWHDSAGGNVCEDSFGLLDYMGKPKALHAYITSVFAPRSQ